MIKFMNADTEILCLVAVGSPIFILYAVHTDKSAKQSFACISIFFFHHSAHQSLFSGNMHGLIV
jgi:hypothetical protein